MAIAFGFRTPKSIRNVFETHGAINQSAAVASKMATKFRFGIPNSIRNAFEKHELMNHELDHKQRGLWHFDSG